MAPKPTRDTVTPLGDSAARDWSLASSLPRPESFRPTLGSSRVSGRHLVLVIVLAQGLAGDAGSRSAVQGRLEQPHLSCALYCRGTILSLELRVDVADVGVDSVHRDR